jgi:alginate O-acetyltransferase complex protein AlgI
MLFSSLVFLFYFLPAALLLYYSSPKSGRNAVLLLISLLFYAWGGIGHLLLLTGSILLNFGISRQIVRNELHAKKWLVAGIVINTALLFWFKYMNFFIGSFWSVFTWFGAEGQLELAKIVLPVGISFYTFHQMSMLRDIYRDRSLPRASLVDTSLYVVFFPQLVAGPIVRYKDIIYQIRSRRETIGHLYDGVQRFIFGLFKKVVIANTCASLADTIMGYDVATLSTAAAWLGALAYTLQIYFDFSGYSDMAVGLAKLFGFTIPENFNFPYVARSVQDFWRRWHISLSTWFRDYVYIPLGGNRKGSMRTYVNLMGVFLLTGFWHGASWSFVFWGAFHGVFLLIERAGWGKVLERLPGIVGWAYTIVVVMIGWVFFRIEAFGDAWEYVVRMFSFTADAPRTVTYFLNAEWAMTLVLGIVLSLVSWRAVTESITRFVPAGGLLEWGRNTVCLVLFVYSVVLLTSSSYNPFIYFNF